jgi:pyrophosphatase PpaX
MFDLLVCADDVERPKPHPEPVHRALRELDAEGGRTLFVGDSVHDMESGRAAGVATGAVLWGPFSREDLAGSSPDHWLEGPEELRELVLGAEG